MSRLGLVVAVVRLGDADGDALVGSSAGLGVALAATPGTLTAGGGETAAVYSTPRTPAHEIATLIDVAASQAAT